MLKNSPFFAGCAVDDVARARSFYNGSLGVEVTDVGPGLLGLKAGNGYAFLLYEKPSHEPAAHTVLNFPVDDTEAAVDELRVRRESRSSSMTRDRSRRTRKGSRHPAPSKRGSAILPETSSP